MVRAVKGSTGMTYLPISSPDRHYLLLHCTLSTTSIHVLRCVWFCDTVRTIIIERPFDDSRHWKDCATGRTASLEGLCHWKDCATGRTVSLEGLRHWKDCVTGRTAPLEGLRHWKDCVTGRTVLLEGLRHWKDCVTGRTVPGASASSCSHSLL